MDAATRRLERTSPAPSHLDGRGHLRWRGRQGRVIGGGERALRGQTLAFLERHHFVNEREAWVGHRRRHLTRKFERCSRKEEKRSIRPSEPQPRTRRLPPRNASSTKMATPSSTAKVSIPAAANTASMEPRVAMPTSRQPVQPMATPRPSWDAVKRAISASRTELAAA